MKNTLISMTDFVFLMRENKKKDNIRRFWTCERYANFLTQPLQKWMFVPCGEDGEVLEEPSHYGKSIDPTREELNKYKQAKERVLFEGFELKGNYIKFKNDLFPINRYKTIEDLVKYNLRLTDVALKTII